MRIPAKEIIDKCILEYKDYLKYEEFDWDLKYRLWRMIYDYLWDHEYQAPDHISHSPGWEFNDGLTLLCFCEKTKYNPDNAIHVSELPCTEAELVWCINLETKEVTQHRKGECPITEYIVNEEE